MESSNESFDSKEKALKWLDQLPEKTALYYLNLIKRVHDRPAVDTENEKLLEDQRKKMEIFLLGTIYQTTVA